MVVSSLLAEASKNPNKSKNQRGRHGHASFMFFLVGDCLLQGTFLAEGALNQLGTVSKNVRIPVTYGDLQPLRCTF